MSHAWYYYNKATTLRPYDPRMWCALAGCYEKQNRNNEAIKCYKRAECNNDSEGTATLRLAKIYQKLEDEDHASHYFKKYLDSKGMLDDKMDPTG